MDNHRVVAGLDVHKDSVYLCIMEESGQIILEKNTGPLSLIFARCEGFTTFSPSRTA